MTEAYATCGICGALVPSELIPEHIAEHDTAITAADVRSAPVIDRTGDED